MAIYACVCVELDLSQPLERGVWVDDGDQKKFIIILYERLPTFSYNCGVVMSRPDS